MALVIQLSLLLATVQLVFVSVSSDKCNIDTLSSKSGNWTWEIPFEGNKDFILEATAQTLNPCMPNSSPEKCLDISYKNKCVRLCLKNENGGIQLSSDLNNCEGSSNSANPMEVTVSSQFITFTPRNIFLPSLDPPNNQKVKITFECAQHTVSICTDNNICLTLSREAKSWIDALEQCWKQNSSLVQITNHTENSKLNVLWQYETALQRGVWIGLERSIFGYNPEWKWISGSKVEYSQWNSSYPVNSLNYHCGKIILVNESKEIKWLDADCHEKLPFICQSLNKIPSHDDVGTLHADLCIDHLGSLNSGYLCIDGCPP